MRKIWLLIFSTFSYFSFVQALEIERRPQFVIIVSSYNNKRWYWRNLSSILMQRYPYFRVIYIDDASPDNTGEFVRRYIKFHNVSHKVQLIINSARRGQLANIYGFAHTLDPEDVIVIVDGDDALHNPYVLGKLSEVYIKKKAWLTYGQFLYCSNDRRNKKIGFAREVPERVIKNNMFRKYAWVFTHLRTFKAGLFQNIKLKDLMYNGYFFKAATDLAAMFPMLEMAHGRYEYIKEPLYSYNIKNPLRTNVCIQRKLDKIIRGKNPYDPLIDLRRQRSRQADVILISQDSNKTKAMENMLIQTGYVHDILIVQSSDWVNYNSDLQSTLNAFIQKAADYLFILTDKISLNTEHIKQGINFMLQSKADVCYLSSKVRKSEEYLIPNFYGPYQNISRYQIGKIMSTLFLRSSSSNQEVAHVLNNNEKSDNAFVFWIRSSS